MAPKKTFARLPILLAFLSLLAVGVQAQEPGNNFNVVESSFRQGDSIQVKTLRRTSDSISLLVNYILGSEEQATLHLVIAGNSPSKPAFDPRQRAVIKKGQGTVMLHFPHAYPGLPCVSLNHHTTGSVLGHLYFGNPDDIAAARMPGVGQSSGGGGSATPSGIVQVKLAKIILPVVGCEKASPAELFEYLSVKSRDYDPTTNDFRLKGLPIMVTSKRKDSLALSLDLQNIPLGEAIRHAAKLGDFRVTYTDTGVVIGDLEENTQASAPAGAPAAQESSPVADKAGRIIFPFVGAENVSFEEAIEYIRVRSRDLDPDKTGIEIAIKPGPPSDKVANLDLKNIPLPTLLGHVAELFGYTVATDAKGYVLTPRS
ncbi:MAG: hypothetical protein ACO1TE_12050 [Prosthecobacter sp.]